MVTEAKATGFGSTLRGASNWLQVVLNCPMRRVIIGMSVVQMY